jgi:uncharacterized membrane protein YoaT (DUF817 family)
MIDTLFHTAKEHDYTMLRRLVFTSAMGTAAIALLSTPKDWALVYAVLATTLFVWFFGFDLGDGRKRYFVTALLGLGFAVTSAVCVWIGSRSTIGTWTYHNVPSGCIVPPWLPLLCACAAVFVVALYDTLCPVILALTESFAPRKLRRALVSRIGAEWSLPAWTLSVAAGAVATGMLSLMFIGSDSLDIFAFMAAAAGAVWLATGADPVLLVTVVMIAGAFPLLEVIVMRSNPDNTWSYQSTPRIPMLDVPYYLPAIWACIAVFTVLAAQAA